MAPAPKVLSDFRSEAQEILDALSRDLLRLGERREGEPDPDLVNRIFRAAHSFKGLSAMSGVERLSRLFHAIEDLLDDLRMGRVTMGEDFVDLLLDGVDVAQRIVGEFGKEGEEVDAQRADRLVERIGARRAESAGASARTALEPLDAIGLDASVRKVLTEYEEHRLRESLRRGATFFWVRGDFELAHFDQGLGALTSRLKSFGEVIGTLPAATPSAIDGGIAFDLLLGTTTPGLALESDLRDLHASVRPLSPPVAIPADRASLGTLPLAPPNRRAEDRAPAARAEASLRSASQTVRVDIRKLDRLMNLVGELVLAKSGLQRLGEAFRAGAARTDPAVDLQRATRLIERKLDELQKGLLEIRMVPLEQVFDKLARMVRRFAREAGKEIDFQFSGADVELDKLIVEELGDPLMHLIRNAIDHGIEEPERREAAGKPRRGTVCLSARQKGNHVVIEISDDGVGIEEEAVRATAIEKGLLTAQGAGELAGRELLNLLFRPGFSTARQVSELSGRGVGLDVVKTNIANLSGLIDLQTRAGEGTSFSLTLPVTLAIIRALVVAVSGRIFAVPLNSVLEIVQVERDEVLQRERREVVEVRGVTLPLVRLSRLLRLDGAEPSGRIFVVVVGFAQQRLGFAVDELVGQQDVVIRPLGKLLAGVKGIAGATDLGHRRTVLVLDVGEIIEEVLSRVEGP